MLACYSFSSAGDAPSPVLPNLRDSAGVDRHLAGPSHKIILTIHNTHKRQGGIYAASQRE